MRYICTAIVATSILAQTSSAGGGGCPAGEIPDCNGNCAPEAWLGDGVCDDGSYQHNGVPIFFNCEEHYCDGGDCQCSFGDVWTVDDDLVDYPQADFTNIQSAVGASTGGDVVLVYPGTYTSSSNLGVVRIYSSAPSELASVGGPDVTIIDGENSRRCIFMPNANTTTTVDGFTITNGRAQDGGGMQCINASPTVINCRFEDNTAIAAGSIFSFGGGLFCYESNITLTDCTFTENTLSSSYRGGAGMYCIYGSPTLTNCDFVSNDAGIGQVANAFGGGMRASHCSPTLTDCTFDGNEASVGGGLAAYASDCSISNCTFQDNTAEYWGGGLHLEYLATAALSNCSFSGNMAWDFNGEYPPGFDVYATTSSLVSFEGQNNPSMLVCIESTSTSLAAASDVQCSTLVLSPGGSLAFDVDAINATSPLDLSGGLFRTGGLGVTNSSASLLNAEIGDVIPLAKASSFSGEFAGAVFPAMPQGLGLRLTEQAGLARGTSELALEVFAFDQTEFADPQLTTVGAPPVDIKTFDVDGDGGDEVAVLFDGAPGEIVVFEGSDMTPIASLSVNVGHGPVDLDSGDLDGDGLEDLIVANGTSNTITVLRSVEQSDGTFLFESSTLSVPGSSQALTCTAVIDWDGDSYLDAVVGVNRFDPNASGAYKVLTDIGTAGNGVGPEAAVDSYDPGQGEPLADHPTCVDGALGGSDSWGFVGGTRYGRIHKSTPNGGLMLLGELNGHQALEMIAQDISDSGGDGQIDLVLASDEAQSIYILDGDASEGDGFADIIPLYVGVLATDVAVMDADFDGDIDIVCAAPTSDSPLFILRNDGGPGLMGGSMGGRSWSRQDMNSNTPTSKVDPGDVGDTKDLETVLVGGGPLTGLQGETAGALESTLISEAPPADILIDQIGGDDGLGVSDSTMACQYFEDSYAQYSVAICESFIVPPKSAIQSVEAVTGGWNGWTDPSGISAYQANLYSSPTAAGNSLEGDIDSMSIDAADAIISATWEGSEYLILIEVTLTTGSGTSWISMIPSLDFSTGGQSGIQQSLIGQGDGCVQANPGQGFGFGPWQYQENDAAFRVTGQLGEGLPCLADLNGDGVVGVIDLLAVIGSWGACEGCAEDINGDGTVGVVDLLEVIGTWGACP